MTEDDSPAPSGTHETSATSNPPPTWPGPARPERAPPRIGAVIHHGTRSVGRRAR